MNKSKIATIHQFGRYELVGPVKLPLRLTNEKIGKFSLWYFEFPGGQYAALVKGDLKSTREPLVRVESVCIWAHLFNSQYCDCRWQLEEAKNRIEKVGQGLIIFAFNQHGKGVGLKNHFLIYAEGQRRNLELVVDSYTSLGFDEDYRKNYQDVVDILKHFRIKSFLLMSNNPERIKILRKKGLKFKRVPLEMPLDNYNRRELITKKKKLGHLLTLKK